MTTYETGILTAKQMRKFSAIFGLKIGTEYEVNKLKDNSYYINCFELTPHEVNICRTIEQRTVR